MHETLIALRAEEDEPSHEEGPADEKLVVDAFEEDLPDLSIKQEELDLAFKQKQAVQVETTFQE